MGERQIEGEKKKKSSLFEMRCRRGGVIRFGNQVSCQQFHDTYPYVFMYVTETRLLCINAAQMPGEGTCCTHSPTSSNSSRTADLKQIHARKKRTYDTYVILQKLICYIIICMYFSNYSSNSRNVRFYFAKKHTLIEIIRKDKTDLLQPCKIDSPQYLA